jgi:ATP-dependent exoDNAse (exonuclease V) beta subunit
MLWPYANSTEEEKKNRILEDARAFYVAMTRSKSKLFFTSSTQAQNGRQLKQSRFKDCIAPFFIKENITNPSQS